MKTEQFFTREQRLNDKCTHDQYYGQFVTPKLIEHVKNRIGEKAIKESKDHNFNDIRLSIWDSLQQSMPSGTSAKLKERGDFLTLSGVVCICKAAARKIKETIECPQNKE